MLFYKNQCIKKYINKIHIQTFLLYLLDHSFQSLAAGLKQSSGRVRVLAGRLCFEHHTGTGQMGPVEDLHTSSTR